MMNMNYLPNEELPNEILYIIFHYIPDFVTLTKVSMVCKTWNGLSSDDRLWENQLSGIFDKLLLQNIRPHLSALGNTALEIFQAIQSLRASEYSKQLKECEPPTAEQCVKYVQYTSNAHSYYKHMTCTLPGVSWSYSLNPFAGWDFHWNEDYSIRKKKREITEEHRYMIKCHSSARTTKVYRENFSCLTTHHIMSHKNRKITKYWYKRVNKSLIVAEPIPSNILKFGTVRVTSFVSLT